MRTLLIVALMFGAFFMQAQRPGGARASGGPKMIKGKVVEQSSQASLEFATVSIFSLPDSSLVTGSITEADGSFSLSINNKASSFYGVVEFIGFENYSIPEIRFEKGKRVLDLGSLALSAGGVELDEVQVTAEKSELQFSLDKRVFNVGKDLGSRGGNATDILDNIPSVTVGVEGEVSLRGSENVRILINGRPSGLVGLGNTNGLRSIQASMIEKVEIITNPSSKFEAEGMAGIINIILRKDRARGFNGAFELTGGAPLTYGAGANVNYRQDKLNWFLNYNYNRRTGPANGSSYQEFYQDDAVAVSLQRSRRDRNNISNSFRFGSEYLISDTESLTAAFLYRHSESNNDNYILYRDSFIVDRSTYLDRLEEEDFDTYLERTDDEFEDSPTLEYSLNYDKKFAGENHRLVADVSFQSNDEKESSDFDENIFVNGLLTESNILNQRSANSEGQNQWRMQLDYERPIADNAKMEAGLLGTFRKIENDYIVETLIDDIWIPEIGLTNDFNYNEDVIGAYYNIGQEFDKWSYQVGLRSEYSHIVTELEQTNELNDRDYFNFFPSGFINYKLGGNNTIQASYSRRIRRPRFWDLNPFFTFTDRRNFFSGNPNLDPEYTDSYEVGHLKYWDWGNIGSSVYYRYTTDVIQRIQIDNPIDQTTVRLPENIGTSENIGIELVFAYTGTSWLRLDGSVNGFRFVTNGVAESGQELDVDNFAWTSNLNTRFTFWNKSDLQFRLNYRAPRETVQGERKSVTSLNIGFSKDVTPDFTVTFSVRDAFNNRRRQSIIDQPNLFQESDFQWRPRTATITLNYRINKKKERPKRGGFDGGGGEF